MIEQTNSSLELIEIVELIFDDKQFEGILLGNAFIHLWQYQTNNGIEDLKKADWYLKKYDGKHLVKSPEYFKLRILCDDKLEMMNK